VRNWQAMLKNKATLFNCTVLHVQKNSM